MWPALIVSTLIIYLRGLTGQFVWDDRTYFLDNDLLPRLSPVDLKDIVLRPSNYWYEHLPVRDFLFVLQHSLFGDNTVGYHLVSLLLYLGTGFVIYRFLLCLYAIEAQRSAHKAPGTGTETAPTAFGALYATAFFLLHPLHVECVSYISGQKDLLFTLFSFGALALLCAAVKDSTLRRPGKLLGITGLYYLSFLSKGTAVATAIALPLVWLLFLRTKNDSLIKAAACWFAVNVPVLLWLIYSARLLLLHQIGLGNPQWLPLTNQLIRAVKILGAHTVLAVKPFPLNFGYPFDDSLQFTRDFWTGLFVLLLFIFCLVAFNGKNRKLALFGGSLFMLYLFPSLKLFIAADNLSVYDRYLFVPIMGVGIVVERTFSALLVRGRMPKWAVFVSAGLVLVLLCAGTYVYVPKFQSDLTSTRNSNELFPDWSESSFNYVYALIEAGALDEAMDISRREKSFDRPPWVRDFFIGWIELEKGETGPALNLLERSSLLCRWGGYYPYPNVALARALLARGEREGAKTALQPVLESRINQPLLFYQAKKLLQSIDAMRTVFPCGGDQALRLTDVLNVVG